MMVPTDKHVSGGLPKLPTSSSSTSARSEVLQFLTCVMALQERLLSYLDWSTCCRWPFLTGWRRRKRKRHHPRSSMERERVQFAVWPRSFGLDSKVTCAKSSWTTILFEQIHSTHLSHLVLQPLSFGAGTTSAQNRRGQADSGLRMEGVRLFCTSGKIGHGKMGGKQFSNASVFPSYCTYRHLMYRPSSAYPSLWVFEAILGLSINSWDANSRWRASSRHQKQLSAQPKLMKLKRPAVGHEMDRWG